MGIVPEPSEGKSAKCILEGGRARMQGLEDQSLASTTWSESVVAGIL